MLIRVLIVACVIAAGKTDGEKPNRPDDVGGRIDGTVVNLSRDGRPAGDVEVVLEAELDGQLATVALTTTDDRGRFAFVGVPLDMDLTYRPAANLGGIHYPGPRVRVAADQPSVDIRLSVRETVSRPCPLIIRRHEIVIEPGQGALLVSEGMLVENPTSKTYVGHSETQGRPPVTFELGVPANFERLTFEHEHFGRNFVPAGGRVVTGIPWEPGQRWIRMTYRMPNEPSERLWTRRLGAPCEDLRVRIRPASEGRENAERQPVYRCNLPSMTPGKEGEVGFRSAAGTLPVGFEVELELGSLPVPWMVHARRAALLVLVVSVAIAAWIARGKRHPLTKDQ